MPKETFLNLSDEKQEKVIRAAVHEFLDKGYEKGNVGAIAKHAGVAKGSMYQYFDNKKELFLYCVQWTSKFITGKYNGMTFLKDMSIFDFFKRNAREMLIQIKQEKELAFFMQEVFLGKFINMNEEPMKVMMKAADDFILNMIRQGKNSGSIRKDIDDRILTLYLLGVTTKIKEDIILRAKEAGTEVLESEYETYESDLDAMFELLNNGMGEKTCL